MKLQLFPWIRMENFRIQDPDPYNNSYGSALLIISSSSWQLSSRFQMNSLLTFKQYPFFALSCLYSDHWRYHPTFVTSPHDSYLECTPQFQFSTLLSHASLFIRPYKEQDYLPVIYNKIPWFAYSGTFNLIFFSNV